MEDTGEAEKQRIDSAALHRISCSCVGVLSGVALFCCFFSFGTFFGFIRVYTDLFSDPIFLMKNLLLSLTSLIIALESVWASVLLPMSLKDFSLNLLPLYRQFIISVHCNKTVSSRFKNSTFNDITNI